MKPVAIDLFAGAGGLSEGLQLAGFNVALASEVNEWAAETYAFNHPETKLLTQDIRKIKPADILAMTEKPLMVAGGPPCQGFSMAGRRLETDPRNHMFFEFIRIVKGTMPDFVLAENVIGLRTFAGGKVLAKIEKELNDTGYHVSMRAVNAADFGVPQLRNRLFMLGALDANFDINELRVRSRKQVTADEAIGDLDFLQAGESSEIYEKEPLSTYQKLMRKGSQKLHNHRASKHHQEIVERYSVIKPGMKAADVREAVKTKKRNFMRIRPNAPINTITTIPDDYVHYSLDRTLTVRECARLQSFPDKYVFLGQRTTGGLRRRVECPQYTQVGNAVPPLLAKAIGSWILKQVR